MKQKRFFLIVFLILFVIISVEGCNKGVEIGKTSNGNNISQVEDKAGKSLPAKLENPNITIFFPANPSDAMNIASQQFEEKYGGKVKIESGDWGERASKLAALINGGLAPDVCVWSEADNPKYIIKNILQPIDAYFDFNDPMWNMSAINMGKYKGQYYGIDNDINAFIIYFNKTLFENNGLNTPLEYYNEGKWNWETFRELAMKLTCDTDGDKNIDQWGYTGRESPLIFAPANQADFIEIADDGSVKLTMHDPKIIETLQFLQDSYIKDKYINTNPKMWKEDFQAGKLAMCVERKIYVNSANLKESMKYEWDIVPFPLGPSGKEGVSPAQISYWGIANGAANPKGATAWIHLKKVFDKNDIDPGLANNFSDAQLKRISEIEKNVQVPKYMGLIADKWVNRILTDVKKGIPVVTIIEQNASIFQREIDLILEEK